MGRLDFGQVQIDMYYCKQSLRTPGTEGLDFQSAITTGGRGRGEGTFSQLSVRLTGGREGEIREDKAAGNNPVDCLHWRPERNVSLVTTALSTRCGSVNTTWPADRLYQCLQSEN